MEKPYVPVKSAAAKAHRPPALMPLISICLSELRGDFARLLRSGWAENERRRARELIATLEEACQRQGLESLAVLFRSMMGLTGLSATEAIPIAGSLREKLEELLRMAERMVSEYSRRQTA
jgi:hypothetical protein